MISYKLHLIRTGSTAMDAHPRLVGQQDLPLSPQGVAELKQLKKDLIYPKVQEVYTSPLRRCVQTGYQLFPDTFTQVLPGLQDLGLGDFEGQTVAQLQEQPDFRLWLEDARQNPPPGGEDLDAFLGRIVASVEEIFHTMMDQRITSAALITHRGVIMTLLAAICLPKQPVSQWAVANGTGFTLLATPQMWMRDHAMEVFAPIPNLPDAAEEDDYWL
ncbi:histidine phosphatase family protein [Oscillospiraceae bacterium MB08-C2-2]|nr:histidine phosphatase family protein [Oscillospiraceae bacterium MB08-C2-2]